MIRVSRSGAYVLVAIVCLGGAACLRLQRPATTPRRMLEPQLSVPAKQVTKAANATPVRLLDTQALGHIGRPVLHQQPNGELTEDAVWRWSSAPDRYLDTALRLEVASSPDVLLVDTSRAPALAATLLEWDLESAGERDLLELWSFRSQGPTVWSIHKWCEPASPFPRNYPATWPPQQAGSCTAWLLRVSRASQVNDKEVAMRSEHLWLT